MLALSCSQREAFPYFRICQTCAVPQQSWGLTYFGVNIKNANLFGGAHDINTAAKLNIQGGATVNLLGDKDAGGDHSKDFDNAGMLAAIGTASGDRTLLIDGTGTKVNVAAHQHGVLQGDKINIDNHAAVNVDGNLLLTGYLGRTSGDTQKVSEALAGAIAGTTTLEHGGLLNIASTGRVSLAPNMTLVLGEAGVLDNKGLLTINTDATLHLIEGSDLTMEGSLTNAGTVLVNSSLDLRDSKGELTNTGTFKIVNKTTNLSAGLDADEQGRVTVTKAQFDKLHEGKIILGDASATNHSRLSVWADEDLTFNTSDFVTSTPSAAGKIQMAKWGSLQANSVTLTGNSLALGTCQYSTTVADNYSLARIKVNTLTLNSGSSDFTLTAGRLYVTGDMAGSALNVGDGTKTLILNGGSLRLGDSEPVIGGVVNGNVTVGGANAGQFEVGSGAWVMAASKTLDIQANSVLIVGGGADLAAKLVIKGTLTSAEAGNGPQSSGGSGNSTPPTKGINVLQNGVLEADSGKLMKDATTIADNLNKIWLDNGGVLKVTGLTSISTTDMAAYKTALVAGGTGLINYGSATVEVSAADKTAAGNLDGAKAEDTSALLAGNTVEYSAGQW